MAPARGGGRWVYWAGVAVGVAGIALAVWPATTTLDAVCPWLARQHEGGASPGMEPNRNAMVYPVARALFWMQGVAARRDEGGNRVFTRSELAGYDGTSVWRPILLGMNGDVFDVTEKGYMHYAPGAGYHCFAGRDSTRALAMGSLEPRDMGRWDVDDFGPSQLANLREQHRFYLDKYVKVGVLDPNAP